METQNKIFVPNYWVESVSFIAYCRDCCFNAIKLSYVEVLEKLHLMVFVT